MLLRLPTSLHYPITVTSLLKQPGDAVVRDEAIFWYVYQTTVEEGDGWGNKVEVQRNFPTKFESPVAGDLVDWKIAKGDVLGEPVDFVEINEPCAHDIQFGGLCADCGKDMTEYSYNMEVTDTMRAPIQIAHHNTTLTVSANEAARIEEDAKRRLLTHRKLSLVVDLDLTIIQATTEPTVWEWMKDKDNPNHEELSDIRRFQLMEDGPGMRGRWYYVKLRPGLETFLENVSEMYELHIYTMGTRSYAKHVAEIIDPTGKFFGDRVLSRDESGSMTAKNLHRLFPVDTKMVVIIDDRADVWQWSPNLIKVVPYEFFPDTGDINSSFLPKKQDEMAGAGKSIENAAPNPPKPLPSNENHVNGAATKQGPDGEVSTLEQLVTMGGGDDPGNFQKQRDAQEELIMHQVEDRPLLQKQKELDAEDNAAPPSASGDSSSRIDETQDPAKARHHLLEDHDRQLFELEVRLDEVHKRFFDEYDQQRMRALGGRVAHLRGEKLPPRNKDVDLQLVPDVKDFMPEMKNKVLRGVVIVYTGVYPQGTDVQNTQDSLWAKSFGAVISRKIDRRTTHLVAKKNRTAKVREATRYPNIKIVAWEWVLDCIIQWKRVKEDPYLLPVHPDDRGEPLSPGSKELDSSWISSDEGTGEVPTDEEDPEEWFAEADSTSPFNYDDAEQAAVHDELREFLGSDDESETDSEATFDNDLDAPSRKRKRGEDSTDDGNSDSDQDSTADKGGGGDLKGSRLSQRIKRSYERSTGLKEVATASGNTTTDTPGDSSPPTEQAEESSAEQPEDPTQGSQEMPYPEEEADDLEREMMAAFEDGEENEEVEEEIAEENG